MMFGYRCNKSISQVDYVNSKVLMVSTHVQTQLIAMIIITGLLGEIQEKATDAKSCICFC